MSDPAERAARLDDRADIARIRDGQDLYTEDEALQLDEGDEQAHPEPQEATGGPTTSGGTRLVTQDEYNKMVRQVASLTREVNKLKTQNAKNARAMKQAHKALKRWMQRYGSAFSEFHGKAKGAQQGTSMVLSAIAKGVGGFIEGTNWGEVPLNPTYLGLAKAIEAISLQYSGDPLVQSFVELAGVWLRYMSFTNPLANDGVSPATAALLNAAAPQFS